MRLRMLIFQHDIHARVSSPPLPTLPSPPSPPSSPHRIHKSDMLLPPPSPHAWWDLSEPRVARQVIFLDSDNVAVADPTSLLESPEFRSTGALLWPDYWTSTAAPDLAAILEVPQLAPGSFESGQMVFDKQKYGLQPFPSPFFTRPVVVSLGALHDSLSWNICL